MLEEVLFTMHCSGLLPTISTIMQTMLTSMSMPFINNQRMELTAITVECPVTEVVTNSSDNTNSPGATDGTTEETDPYNAHLAQSFVLVATPSMTEQEAMQQSVREKQSILHLLP